MCFVQAEDGIRDIGVTGVQTCALPICVGERTREGNDLYGEMEEAGVLQNMSMVFGQMNEAPGARFRVALTGVTMAEYFREERSEERRLGKECRSRWSPHH